MASASGGSWEGELIFDLEIVMLCCLHVLSVGDVYSPAVSQLSEIRDKSLQRCLIRTVSFNTTKFVL